jgi:hypothetical protein
LNVYLCSIEEALIAYIERKSYSWRRNEGILHKKEVIFSLDLGWSCEKVLLFLSDIINSTNVWFPTNLLETLMHRDKIDMMC